MLEYSVNTNNRGIPIMAIDINKLNTGHPSQLKGNNASQASTAQQRSSSAQGQPTPAAQQAVPKDSVSLTQQAQSLGQMQKTMASTPSFNQEKVASLKKAVAEGQYKVDPEKLAQKLQEFETELGNIMS